MKTLKEILITEIVKHFNLNQKIGHRDDDDLKTYLNKHSIFDFDDRILSIDDSTSDWYLENYLKRTKLPEKEKEKKKKEEKIKIWAAKCGIQQVSPRNFPLCLYQQLDNHLYKTLEVEFTYYRADEIKKAFDNISSNNTNPESDYFGLFEIDNGCSFRGFLEHIKRNLYNYENIKRNTARE